MCLFCHTDLKPWPEDVIQSKDIQIDKKNSGFLTQSSTDTGWLNPVTSELLTQKYRNNYFLLFKYNINNRK